MKLGLGPGQEKMTSSVLSSMNFISYYVLMLLLKVMHSAYKRQ